MTRETIALTVVVLVLLTGLVLNAQIDMNNEFTRQCDKDYGENNWTLEYRTDKVLFIGEVWECIPKYTDLGVKTD